MPSYQSHRPANGSRPISASATVERHTVQLDARSAVALDFATFYLRRHASIRPTSAVVVRRALQLLANHLSNLTGADLARECRAFMEAGKGSGSALTLTQARARIEEHQRAPGAQPMAHWNDALHSVEENRQSREMLARVQAVMADAE